MMKKQGEKLFYDSFEDDFVKSKNQNYEIDENFKWHNKNPFLYFIARIFCFIYCKLILRVKLENKEILKKYKNQGYFLYGNHTQPFGDACIPVYICGFFKKMNVIVSSANLGIPVIGKFLPKLGAIPIPKGVKKLNEFEQVIKDRIDKKECVVVYPEAHVWTYYTKIRPFSDTSFKYAVDNDSIVFCMTTTYYKRKFFKKPGIKIFIDGPFYVDKSLDKKDSRKKLCYDVHKCMENRSKFSNYEYILYEKKENK